MDWILVPKGGKHDIIKSCLVSHVLLRHPFQRLELLFHFYTPPQPHTYRRRLFASPVLRRLIQPAPHQKAIRRTKFVIFHSAQCGHQVGCSSIFTLVYTSLHRPQSQYPLLDVTMPPINQDPPMFGFRGTGIHRYRTNDVQQ